MNKKEYLLTFEEDLLANQEQITNEVISFLKKRVRLNFIVGIIVFILSVVAEILFYLEGNDFLLGLYVVCDVILFFGVLLVVQQLNKQKKKLKTNYSEYVKENVETLSFTSSQTKLLKEDAEAYVLEIFVRANKNTITKKIFTLPKEAYLIKGNSVNEKFIFYLSLASYKRLWSNVPAILFTYRYKENGELFILKKEGE
ncbi:hypothetical protein SAMN02745116_00986 [Pilibacter termitis]|uniref:Uncharacterized protein n=1 Tax=Pilibacter termitis TaxID=263852 RepID=A0A1T4M7K0_9ENTE|nr:hypothetical protein [Pilibacter termitis]SJZ62902.1 hypothetical protein SAMN02745116_00986 [Pilibacter termitis]